MRKFLLIVLGLLITTVSSYAQGGQGGIKATVTEASNGLPIPFANVAVKQNGSLITGGSTDFDGVVEINLFHRAVMILRLPVWGLDPLRLLELMLALTKPHSFQKRALGWLLQLLR